MQPVCDKRVQHHIRCTPGNQSKGSDSKLRKYLFACVLLMNEALSDRMKQEWSRSRNTVTTCCVVIVLHVVRTRRRATGEDTAHHSTTKPQPPINTTACTETAHLLSTAPGSAAPHSMH